MISDLLSGLIWQARAGLQAGNARAFAAHGYVDNAYRPPRLPFVSVVGPLSFNVEPEREAGKQASAPVRVPGHLIGRPRVAADVVPAAGVLRLRFDGHATVTLAGLPGGSFGDAATGPALAAAIHTAIQTALAADQFTGPDGGPLDEPTLVAALAQAACRFDPETRRLAVVSDPGVPALEHLSRVEVLEAPGSVAGALGLSPPESARDGRTFLHRLPPPRAFTFDVQVNLWASNQQDLATLMERLAVMAPTRGNLMVRPALLLDDAPDGATTLRLLEEGEPTLVDSWLHLEAPGGFSDRARGMTVTTTAGAATAANPARLAFTNTGTCSARLYATPLIPTPLHAPNPAPRGLAVSLGLRLNAGGANGQRIRVVDIAAGATSVLRLEVALTTVQGQLRADLDATATVRRGGAAVGIRTVFRLPVSALQDAFAQVHVLLDANAGVLLLWVDGEAHRRDDAAQTPVPPVSAPGSTTAAAPDMLLTVGQGGAGNPLGFALTNLHVVGTPLGALDPALRRSVNGSSRLQPGDPLILARSEDGVRPGGVRCETMVAAVDGEVVHLTRPVRGSWRRGQTLAFRDESFYFQTSIKRRDDLLNRLYRACVDYRVSALIEDERTLPSAVLAETPIVDVVPLGATVNASGAPGVTATITDRGLPRTITKLGA